jgi:hypothetical protein
LVFSIHDSTEEAIKKMIIEASQRMIRKDRYNPAINKLFEVEIKMLQNVSKERRRYAKKASESKRMRKKSRQCTHRRHAKVGYREVEMLRVVLQLVESTSRKKIEGAITV